MPRNARIKSTTGIYHIILRSVNQQIIFEEESDFKKFLYILSDCKEKYDFDIYAYCLMSNHIHLLLNDRNNKLSSIFQSLESRFARWYNQKYHRFGHLFQERYFSSPVLDNQYFINVFIYIHANPVTSNTCQYMTEYSWSSARAYWGTDNPLVDSKYVYELVGSKDNLKRILSHLEYADNNLKLDGHSSQPLYFSDEIAFEKFKKVSNLNSPSDIQRLPKVERNGLIRRLAKEQLSYKQIARFCGITKTTVYRIMQNYK